MSTEFLAIRDWPALDAGEVGQATAKEVTCAWPRAIDLSSPFYLLVAASSLDSDISIYLVQYERI